MAFRVFFNLVFHTVELFIYVSISLSLLSIVLSFLFVAYFFLLKLFFLPFDKKFIISVLKVLYISFEFKTPIFSLHDYICLQKRKKNPKNIDTKVENKTMKKFSCTTL